jgi:tetratricopeptide (TPR) repeat protein
VVSGGGTPVPPDTKGKTAGRPSASAADGRVPDLGARVLTRVRAHIKRASSSVPIYRILPPGAARDHAALHRLRHDDRAVVEYLRRSSSCPTRFFSAGWIAARAAFEVGADDIAEAVLSGLLDRFPEVAEVPRQLGELAVYRGDYDRALEHAIHARLIEPSSAAAAASAVRAYYLSDAEAADQFAVEAIEAFPRSVEVLYAACSECRTLAQFQKLAESVDRTRGGPRDLRSALRPLAAGAARINRLETAMELYAEAILLVLHGEGPTALAGGPQLRRKSAWETVRDVGDALEGAGIPHFFAAGTALGLVREGRPLRHDSDVDVGVLEEDWDREALQEVFRHHPSFQPRPVHPAIDKIALRHRGGIPVDVFRFYRGDGRVWHDGTFVRWHNSPFDIQDLDLGGRRIPVPRPDDRYLTESYGDWRRPDPGFDAFTDAPNAEITRSDYLDYYLTRRAYLTLTSGVVRAARRDLRSASSSVSATPSGRQVLGLLEIR